MNQINQINQINQTNQINQLAAGEFLENSACARLVQRCGG
jgi:hypothetical protein